MRPKQPFGCPGTYPQAPAWAGRSGLGSTGGALKRQQRALEMPASESLRGQGRDPARLAPSAAPPLQGPRAYPLTLPNPLLAGPPVAQEERDGADDRHQRDQHPEEHRPWNTEQPCSVSPQSLHEGVMAVSLGPCCHHTGLVPDSLLHLPGHTLHCGWQDLVLKSGLKLRPCIYVVQPLPTCHPSPGSGKPIRVAKQLGEEQTTSRG